MARLRLDRLERIAIDIWALTLREPQGGPLPAFTPGAHVSVTSPNGAVRRYSLCNAPREGDRYELAVKRDPKGHGGSVNLVDTARPGDLLEVSNPHNAFELVPQAPGYVFIAGGIGITPILSMVRSLVDTSARFHLHYLTRSPEECAFREELLEASFGGKVTLHHDGGEPARAYDLWPLLERPSRDHVYCCGPRGLLEQVRAMSGHWPPGQVHFESFIDAVAAAKPEDRPFTVVLALSGIEVEVPAGVSILEAGRASGAFLPSSCESGTCGTCRTRLLEGRADHRDLVLMADERDDWIMPCVSRALTPRLVLDG